MAHNKKYKIYRLIPVKDNGLRVEWIMDTCKKSRICPIIFYNDMDDEFRSIIPKNRFQEVFLDYNLQYLFWRSRDDYLICRDPRKIDYV